MPLTTEGSQISTIHVLTRPKRRIQLIFLFTLAVGTLVIFSSVVFDYRVGSGFREVVIIHEEKIVAEMESDGRPVNILKPVTAPKEEVMIQPSSGRNRTNHFRGALYPRFYKNKCYPCSDRFQRWP